MPRGVDEILKTSTTPSVKHAPLVDYDAPPPLLTPFFSLSVSVSLILSLTEQCVVDNSEITAPPPMPTATSAPPPSLSSSVCGGSLCLTLFHLLLCICCSKEWNNERMSADSSKCLSRSCSLFDWQLPAWQHWLRSAQTRWPSFRNVVSSDSGAACWILLWSPLSPRVHCVEMFCLGLDWILE